MGNWNPDDTIAYECACEAITHMSAILTSQIADEKSKEHPDAELVAVLRAERSRMLDERDKLHVKDQATIARVRTKYGARVRSWRAEQAEQHQAVAV